MRSHRYGEASAIAATMPASLPSPPLAEASNCPIALPAPARPISPSHSVTRLRAASGADSFGAVLILPASDGAGATFLAARFAGSAIRFYPRAASPAWQRIAQDRAPRHNVPGDRRSGLRIARQRDHNLQPRCVVFQREVPAMQPGDRGGKA